LQLNVKYAIFCEKELLNLLSLMEVR
jgi:hypothetical protein